MQHKPGGTTMEQQQLVLHKSHLSLQLLIGVLTDSY